MDRQEKIALIITTSGPGDQSARRSYLDGLTDLQIDGMVDQIRLRAAEATTRQAKTDLLLVQSGLRNVSINFANIKRRLGESYTIQQVRAVVETDDSFKRSLVWDAEPFAAAKQEEQQDLQAEQERRRKFSATARAITSQGIANIADTDANYQVALSQLDDILVSGSASSLSEALALKLIEGLAPNDAETVSSIDQQNRAGLLQSIAAKLTHSQYGGTVRQQILNGSNYADLRERVLLVGELADSHSPDKTINDNYFCSLFCSVRDLTQLRLDLEQTRERKRLRSLSPQELRAENQRVREFDTRLQNVESEMTSDGYRRLRPESRWKGQELNMKNIARLDKEDVKSLLRLYGKNQIDQRLAETRGF
jgi:hypothetical protein